MRLTLLLLVMFLPACVTSESTAKQIAVNNKHMMSIKRQKDVKAAKYTLIEKRKPHDKAYFKRFMAQYGLSKLMSQRLSYIAKYPTYDKNYRRLSAALFRQADRALQGKNIAAALAFEEQSIKEATYDIKRSVDHTYSLKTIDKRIMSALLHLAHASKDFKVFNCTYDICDKRLQQATGR